MKTKKHCYKRRGKQIRDFKSVTDEHEKVRFVKWCEEMEEMHPHYDFIDLMIWAYEAGKYGGFLLQEDSEEYKNEKL